MMAENRSESGNEVAAGDACAHCGETIDTSEWHPMISRTDSEETYRVYAFCSLDCRNGWIDE